MHDDAMALVRCSAYSPEELSCSTPEDTDAVLGAMHIMVSCIVDEECTTLYAPTYTASILSMTTVADYPTPRAAFGTSTTRVAKQG
jgi:hypothetical protein